MIEMEGRKVLAVMERCKLIIWRRSTYALVVEAAPQRKKKNLDGIEQEQEEILNKPQNSKEKMFSKCVYELSLKD